MEDKMNIEFPESYPMAGGDFFNICTVVFPILSVHLPLARKKHMPING